MVHPPGPSKTRKHCLLVIFCFVQFLDAFNFSAFSSALPRIQEDLKMSDGETTWIISAFQLTFASFLLLSGRLSDLYNPSMFDLILSLSIRHLNGFTEYTFVIATLGIGVLSVITGFLQSKIPFIICRALAGISEHLCINLLSKALITFVLVVGAMTIPSALTLLVKLFPEPYEQSQAIGTFGGSGGIGNGTSEHVSSPTFLIWSLSARSDDWCNIREMRILALDFLVPCHPFYPNCTQKCFLNPSSKIFCRR